MLKVPRLFPNDQSQYAVVYQYWPQMEGAPVHKQPFIPILQSIATVRHYSPKVAMYVIDYSEKEGTWGDYPRRFNFTVIRQNCWLASILFRYKKKMVQGMADKANFVLTEHLSRAMDVWNLSHQIDQRYIVYTDTDMLWRQPCMPITRHADLFQCRDNNTGLFYFDKRSTKVEDLMEIWMGYSMLAAKDARFRLRVLSCFTYEGMQDEATFRYIKIQCPDTYRRCVQELDVMENFNPVDYSFENVVKFTEVKSLHLMGYAYGQYRSGVAWLLREFHPIMVESFTKQECEEIFPYVLGFGASYDLTTLRDGILNQDLVKRQKYYEFGHRLKISLDTQNKTYIP